jgi:hypothetical protein
MNKPRIGDIIEIPTNQGLAYAQYTHQHPRMGGLIHIFDQIFQKRPDSFDDLVHGPVRFCVFFPVTAAIKRRIFAVVSNVAAHPILVRAGVEPKLRAKPAGSTRLTHLQFSGKV